MADMGLPANPSVAEFDALQAEPARWLPVVAELAAPFSHAPLRAPNASTVLVGLAGSDCVVKLFPPVLADHCAFEREALQQVHGRLPVPTPRLVASGERAGWPWLVMSHLPGQTLDTCWDTLAQPQRLALLREVGRVAAALHALPDSAVAAMRTVAPDWQAFLRGQFERCEARQRRTGLPAHLLAQVPAFLQAGPVRLHVVSCGTRQPHLTGAAALNG
jgi:hygromycin-B 7''-O-kinase